MISGVDGLIRVGRSVRVTGSQLLVTATPRRIPPCQLSQSILNQLKTIHQIAGSSQVIFFLFFSNDSSVLFYQFTVLSKIGRIYFVRIFMSHPSLIRLSAPGRELAHSTNPLHHIDCWAGVLSVRLNFTGCFFLFLTLVVIFPLIFHLRCHAAD